MAKKSTTQPPRSPSFKRDIEFLFEIGCMRFIQRTWRQFLNPDFENLSEHTLRVAWIAMTIAKHEGDVDLGKIVKMALMHDLSESRGVDVHYVSRQFTDRHEKESLLDMITDTALRDEIFEICEEYEERKSIEAKIVKDADNLDVDFELREQAVRGFTLEKDWHEMRQKVADTKLYTKTAKHMWAELQTSNPNSWHINSTNRMNSGDWKK